MPADRRRSRKLAPRLEPLEGRIAPSALAVPYDLKARQAFLVRAESEALGATGHSKSKEASSKGILGALRGGRIASSGVIMGD
jgi:hypothetical protein